MWACLSAQLSKILHGARSCTILVHAWNICRTRRHLLAERSFYGRELCGQLNHGLIRRLYGGGNTGNPFELLGLMVPENATITWTARGIINTLRVFGGGWNRHAKDKAWARSGRIAC